MFGNNHSGRRIATGIALLICVAAVFTGAIASAGSATTHGKNGLILFSEEVGGHFQLFTVAADGSATKQITHVGAADVVNADWSPGGTTIVTELDFPSRAEISLLAADGSDLRVLAPKGFQGQPSFSPDGKSIVYERDVAPRDGGVWLMRSDGTGVRRVTRSPFGCCDTDPNFSPDGKLITFVRIKQDEKLQAIFAVRPDGSGLRQLTPYSWEVAIKHDWAPNGKSIVVTTNADFVLPKEAANLVTIRPDGSGAKQLTHFAPGENAFAGSFSPDGKLIVFRYERGDSYALATIPRSGGKLRLLTPLRKAKPRFIDWGTHRP
jgi:TolB protein